MERLTIEELQNAVLKFNELSFNATELCEEETNARIIKDIHKAFFELMNYRDFERRFGIDLITIFNALMNGFYYKNKDGNIYYSAYRFIIVGTSFVKTKPCYQVKTTTLDSCYYGDVEPFLAVEQAHYWSWTTHEHVEFKDYGKTWALTKEELKKELSEEKIMGSYEILPRKKRKNKVGDSLCSDNECVNCPLCVIDCKGFGNDTLYEQLKKSVEFRDSELYNVLKVRLDKEVE